jgi:hypothetical protein
MLSVIASTATSRGGAISSGNGRVASEELSALVDVPFESKSFAMALESSKLIDALALGLCFCRELVVGWSIEEERTYAIRFGFAALGVR